MVRIHFPFVTVPLLPFTMMLNISAEMSLSSFSLCVMLPVLVEEINLKSIYVGIVRYCNVLWGFFLNGINLTVTSWAQHFHPFILYTLSFSIASLLNVFSIIIYPSTIVNLFSILPPNTHIYFSPFRFCLWFLLGKIMTSPRKCFLHFLASLQHFRNITNCYVNNWFMAVTAWRWHCTFLLFFPTPQCSFNLFFFSYSLLTKEPFRFGQHWTLPM